MTTERTASFGVKLPIGDETSADDYLRIANAAETHGFETAWLGEHVIIPADPSTEYPYSSGESFPFSTDEYLYDVFQLLTFVAANTSDLRVGTHITIAPLRHPVLLAKNALTLDVLSDGRFEFGVGVGWSSSEFGVLGVPFEERGSRTDEFLEVFDAVRASGEVEFDGPHHAFQRTGFYPRPRRDGGPPIWVGGESQRTFERVAAYGDGWAANNLAPGELENPIRRLERAWDARDRDGSPSVSVKQSAFVGSPPTGLSPSLVGQPDAIVEDVADYCAAGVTHVIPDFRRPEEPGDGRFQRFPIEAQVEQIERFGEAVLPHFVD